MSSEKEHIPIVDFSQYAIDRAENSVSKAQLQRLSNELVDVLTTVGFVYLKNTGIKDEKKQAQWSKGDAFFDLPKEIKQLYSTKVNDDGQSNKRGWINLGNETLNKERPHCYKEAFNFTPSQPQVLPDTEIAGFNKAFKEFYDDTYTLGLRILKAVAIGLKLKDEDIFVRQHDSTKSTNVVTLRYLRYPPLDGTELQVDQIRCGEHSDYGSIILLHQDDIGGLQVLSSSGEYIDAMPIPGTVLVNIGDLMQRWTADKLVATKHRVVFPSDEDKLQKVRRSTAFFMTPDLDTLIECVDGSAKYQPITSLEYITSMFQKTFI